ncbi:MAG: hypothetical protein ABMA64_38765 [Myxococcota bacterium]
MNRSGIGVCVWWWMCACNPEPATSDSSVTCPERAMVHGTGETAVEPLVVGQELTIVNGPQGGWHVWTAAELTGFGPEITVLGSVVATANGAVLASATSEPVWMDLSVSPGDWTYDPATCAGAFYGHETRLDDFVPAGGDSTLEVICNLNGRSLDVTLEVTDVASGEALTSTVAVLGRPDQTTQTSCAQLP